MTYRESANALLSDFYRNKLRQHERRATLIGWVMLLGSLAGLAAILWGMR